MQRRIQAGVVLLGTLILSVGCASAPAALSEVLDASTLRANLDAPFPDAGQALVLDDTGDDAQTMLEALDAFREATGMSVWADAATNIQLQQSPLGLRVDIEVQPDEVYPFFEGLLLRNGYYLAPVNVGTAPAVSLVSSKQNPNHEVRHLLLSQERARVFAARHPAVLLETQLTLPGRDTHAVGKSLGRMVVGDSFEQVRTVGAYGIVLKACGSSMSSLLAAADTARAKEFRADQQEGK